MYTMHLKNSDWNQVKIEKTEDYYNLFVSMLKIEDKKLHTYEHLWLLGIDEAGYAVCAYIVVLSYPNFFSVDPIRLFKTALQHNSVKIIIAQSKPDTERLSVTPTDLDLTNAVYHKAEILGLELVDHIVISNSSTNSKTPLYCSHLECGTIYFVQNDMTYKSYDRIKPELDKAKKEEVDDAIHEEKINIAKSMLTDKIDINIISKHTGLSKKDIDILKKDMKE